MPNKKSVVLLIHGFMGHPGEFAPLVDFIERQGIATHRVCLPQHGDRPGNLAEATWQDFVQVCQDDLDYCRSRYEQVHLVGFSLGGALSLVLNRDNPGVIQSVTLVAAPCRAVFNLDFGQYHLRHFFNRFLPGTQYWYQANTGFPKPYLLPIHMVQFYQEMIPFFNEVQEAVDQLTSPTLLVHSPYDLTVPYEHSEWLYQNIPGEVNFLTVLNCGHQVFPYHVKGVVEETIFQHICQSRQMSPSVLLHQDSPVQGA